MDIIIYGIYGRMGRSLIDTAAELDINLSGGIDKNPPAPTLNNIPISDDLASIKSGDVVIDFSTPDASLALLAYAEKTKSGLVIGTTGFTPAQPASIEKAAEQIAIVQSGNMSLGVHILTRLVEQAAKACADWDIEIFEMHHRDKKDAPSGTALLLGEAAQRNHTQPLLDRSGARPDGAIGYSVARGGSVIGDHKVSFLTQGERITLAHNAQDRHIFARGALRAAQWVAQKPAGLYSLDDVLA